ncbi:peptidoglycan-binding protein, partial [Streptomyces sp. SR27]|uniref:peptidoglycan-binding domain-containing protein n=1 Tax=Streptomyces sp. SR27 TaxID=3076630 RepID=UPI00295A877B
ETDDRAAVPEVTTSASLNLAVSEAPSATSETPEPTSSSPTPHPTTESPSPTPSATRTTASPSPSPTTTGAGAPPASTPPETPVAPPTTTPATTPSPTATKGEPEEVLTLSIGSSGPEVRDLQRRLTDVGMYGGHTDGKYDRDVRDAVWLYQSYMYIQGDPSGVYGPNTREVLERYTPHI